MSKETSQQAVLVGWLGTAAKGCGSRRTAGILLAVIHLLAELFGLLLVDETEAGQALLELKRVKKCAVLVVVPRVEDFLVPDDAAVCRLRGNAIVSRETQSR